MRKLVKVLAAAISVETCNFIVYNFFLDPLKRPEYAAIVSILVTLSVLLYVGFHIGRLFEHRPLLKSSICGLFVWFVVTVLLAGLFNVLGIGGRDKEDGPWGPWIAFVLFSPFAAVVPMLGVLLGRGRGGSSKLL